MWPFKRHKHQWTVVRATPAEYSRLSGHTTQLSCRCVGCGVRGSWVIDGVWLAEDFKNELL